MGVLDVDVIISMHLISMVVFVARRGSLMRGLSS